MKRGKEERKKAIADVAKGDKLMAETKQRKENQDETWMTLPVSPESGRGGGGTYGCGGFLFFPLYS